MQQREGQTIEQYAQKVEEVGRRAGVSECDLMSEEDFHQRRQSHTGERVQSQRILKRPSPSVDTRGEQAFSEAGRAGADGCFNCGGLGHL
ncbi:hypothetical protein T09_11371 [Trichinella sp. T9]|nr:hypothetical protein T09_3323 [Trichinella sp. T9]KRX59702.1 hypothetical protein T09_11371 [Trichinella sp. T9]